MAPSCFWLLQLRLGRAFKIIIPDKQNRMSQSAIIIYLIFRYLKNYSVFMVTFYFTAVYVR